MSSLKLIIGNKNYSSWSLRPWLFLKELEIDFEEQLVHLFKEETAEILSNYFSNDKVPLLIDVRGKDNLLEVWDTLSIIEYIADQYSDGRGWPQSASARAVARSVSAEMHSSFNALRGALPMNCRKHFENHPISYDVQQDVDRIVSIWDYCSDSNGANGNWLFGEFSGADAMFAPVVLRLIGYDVPLSGFAAEYSQMVLENNHVQDWVVAGKKEIEVIEQDEA